MPRTLAIWILIGGLLVGCKPGPIELPQAGDVPPDLTVLFHVAGDPDARARTERPAVYLMEADRTLRVALGDGTTPGTYPPVTARLSHRQARQVYDAVADGGLMWIDMPGELSPGEPVYTLEITADGRTRRMTTTPADTPQTTPLLSTLADFTGLE